MTPNHQIQDKRENQSTRTPMAVVKVLELVKRLTSEVKFLS
jgi:hypothetical protein